MKRTTRTILASTLLAGTALAGTTLPASAVEQPAPGQWITPVASIYYEGMKHGEEVTGAVHYDPIGVPFAETRSGKVIVGDSTDHANTRTWVPWTGEVILNRSYSSTLVTGTPKAGAVHVRGGIATKYLDAGGEAKLGRATGNEYTGAAGRHAAATPIATQNFTNGRVQWSKPHGAHPIAGAIGRAYDHHGGANSLGAVVTDEYRTTVNGKTVTRQTFERGHLDYTPATGVTRR